MKRQDILHHRAILLCQYVEFEMNQAGSRQQIKEPRGTCSKCVAPRHTHTHTQPLNRVFLELSFSVPFAGVMHLDVNRTAYAFKSVVCTHTHTHTHTHTCMFLYKPNTIFYNPSQKKSLEFFVCLLSCFHLIAPHSHKYPKGMCTGFLMEFVA